MNQCMFTISYWYNYGRSLFCELRCCAPKYNTVQLSDNAGFSNNGNFSYNTDDPSVGDNVDYNQLITSDHFRSDVDESTTNHNQSVEIHN